MARQIHPAVGFEWVFGLIFWIFVLLLIVAIVKSFDKSHNDESIEDEVDSNHALNILKERYAKGELTSREFEKMKKEIA